MTSSQRVGHGRRDAANGEIDGLPVPAEAVLRQLARSVVLVGMDERIIFWNKGAEDLFGWSEDEALGRPVSELLVSPGQRESADIVLEEIAREGRWQGDFAVRRRDGSEVLVNVTNQQLVDDDGNVVATIGISDEVTERRRLEESNVASAEHERISRERLEFLRTITDVLVDARSVEEVMANVTSAAVPRLGDWCSISVMRPGASEPEVAIAHADPDMVAFAQDLQRRFPYDPAGKSGVPNVMRTGQVEFIPEITSELMDAIDASDEVRQLLDELALRSAITVPLIKWGRVLGAMQFVGTDVNRRFTADDVILAQAVGGRIASTLENLRLLEQQRDIATTLQASLLPAVVPQLERLDIAVRYWAAGEGTEVGGDFYDVFDARDGRSILTIGDVCGNGPEAAALTGMARHTLRDAVWHGDNPVEALASLNRAMISAATESFCTAVVVAVHSPTVDAGAGPTAERSDAVTIDLALGGHPRPIVVGRDGAAAQAGHPGTLIGVFDDAHFSLATTELEPGAVLVLYTDGATDVPAPYGLVAEEMVELARDACIGQGSAESVAARLQLALHARLPMDRRNDDIALLVVRVND